MSSVNTNVEKKIRADQPWDVIKGLRVQAAERGIPPARIDQMILQGEFGTLSPEVRAILESQISGVKIVEANEVVAEVSGIPEQAVGVSKSVESDVQDVDRVDISGLNIVDKMKQIVKDEALESGATVETSEEKPQEVAVQTSEQKELTTTQGTQNTSSGISKRQSLGVYGYAPSEEVGSNAHIIANKGSVSEARTWQAVFLQRFRELWGSFSGLFTT